MDHLEDQDLPLLVEISQEGLSQAHSNNHQCSSSNHPKYQLLQLQHKDRHNHSQLASHQQGRCYAAAGVFLAANVRRPLKPLRGNRQRLRVDRIDSYTW